MGTGTPFLTLTQQVLHLLSHLPAFAYTFSPRLMLSLADSILIPQQDPASPDFAAWSIPDILSPGIQQLAQVSRLGKISYVPRPRRAPQSHCPCSVWGVFVWRPLAPPRLGPYHAHFISPVSLEYPGPWAVHCGSYSSEGTAERLVCGTGELRCIWV